MNRRFSPSALHRRGFTLLEILVVIGIILLLAAVLFPVVSRVRATGRRTTCASNLRQLGVALNLYAQDVRSLYPVIDADAASNPDKCAPWADKLFPYVKSEKIFECPSNPYGLYRSGCPADDKSDPEHVTTWSGSYNLNINYGFALRNAQGQITRAYIPRATMSTARYTRPSTTILVLDGDGTYVNPGFDPLNRSQEQPLVSHTQLESYGVPDRHEGGVNAGFADGHVKWMSLDSLTKRSLWRINGPA